MKYSIFNNTLTISSAYGLIYNAYTNIYVLLKIDQYHTLPVGGIKLAHI